MCSGVMFILLIVYLTSFRYGIQPYRLTFYFYFYFHNGDIAQCLNQDRFDTTPWPIDMERHTLVEDLLFSSPWDS